MPVGGSGIQHPSPGCQSWIHQPTYSLNQKKEQGGLKWQGDVKKEKIIRAAKT